MPRGLFITFEGGEGAGKSTQIERLAKHLRARRLPVVTTREPGGSPGAEAVRHVLLSGAAEAFGPAMEAILFAAARSDHVEQLIKPAVASGKIVLCDRFVDSHRVYQGVTGDLDPKFMAALERTSVGDMFPDLTIILDIEPREGLRRAAERRGSETADRFEKESLAIHNRRRKAFLSIAKSEPDRCVVVDAGREADEIATEIANSVDALVAARRPSRSRKRA